MEKRKYMFQKKVTNGDNLLRFVYVGNVNNNNFIYDDIIKVIDNCFDNLIFYRDMERNVSFIRTIFKDFDETNLHIEVITPSYREKVRYSNKELYIYNLEHTINLNKFNDIFNFSYVIGRGVNFSITDNDNDLFKSPFIDGYKKIIDDSMDKLYRLNNIDTIKLDRDSIQLCEMYKLFYGEVPDFTNKDINTLMQVMLSILNQFEIKLGYKKNYRIYFPFGEKMPISYDLEELLRGFGPFGKVDIEDNSKLSLRDREIIKIIGNDVRKYIVNDENMIDSLIILSTILYNNGYDKIDKFDRESLDLYTKYPEEQINSSIKLIKRIDKNILNR